ncbi:MAG: T9SS type A sorting domain-containing protein [Candidatus Latescibacterota bacterium]
MRRIRWFLLPGILIAASSAFGANFAPPVLKITAPATIRGNDSTGKTSFPITILGAPATVIFAVFSEFPEGMASACRNGYLGWHYTHLVDTCIYVSPPMHFGKGQQQITWNARDAGVKIGYSADYAYYLWGYDDSSPGVKATNLIPPNRFARAQIVTHDTYWKPMSNPAIFDALPWPGIPDGTSRITRSRWILGYDPEDPTLRETTMYQDSTNPEHRSANECARIVLDPVDYSRFFTQEIRPNGTIVLTRRRWVPNAESYIETSWGKNDGEAVYPSLYTTEGLLPGGPVSDGNLLLFPNIWPGEDGPRSGVIAADPVDGAVMSTIDLTRWWRDDSGAVVGPADLEFPRIYNSSREFLFCSSPISCLNMMLSLRAEEGTDPVRWVNGNGDSFADRNFGRDSPNPRACSDLEYPLHERILTADSNLFTLFPTEGGSTAAFGLFGPDGTGIGHLPLPGIDAVQALRAVDYGSAFDGLYIGGIFADGDSAGIRHIPSDSFRGRIVFGEWWGHPYIHVLGPYEQEVLRAGSTRQVIWEKRGGDGMHYPIVRIWIELSIDGGASWFAVADSVDTESKRYAWTVPRVNSNHCRIRITGKGAYGDSPVSGMSGTFTITGPAGVSEGNEAPRTFTVANYPNPFNPSTTITFTLPQAGQTSLTVYDTTGRKVAELAKGYYPGGYHSIIWNTSSCASGVYFCTLRAGERVETRKMLLVR